MEEIDENTVIFIFVHFKCVNVINMIRYLHYNFPNVEAKYI